MGGEGVIGQGGDVGGEDRSSAHAESIHSLTSSHILGSQKLYIIIRVKKDTKYPSLVSGYS